MASTSLLNFPPEVLINILAHLPIQSLLRFSRTSRYAHSLASCSLHTLSLGIHPTRVSAMVSRLGATQYSEPRQSKSAFATSNRPAMASSPAWNSKETDIEADWDSDGPSDDNPYHVAVLIPDAQTFDYATLLGFHTALTKSILLRHGGALRNLDLSLWTLTTPVAKALASLSALRALSIRLGDLPHVRAMPRNRIAQQRSGQREAWGLLTQNAVWAPRLDALRIEGADLSTSQLATLLGRSRWCRELWLCKCGAIGNELWNFLGTEWQGRAALRVLGVMGCGGLLDGDALDAIGNLSGLQVSTLMPFVIDRDKVGSGLTGRQFLDLSGSRVLDGRAFETRNKDDWRLSECIPPLVPWATQNGPTYIEVDPLYMSNHELST